MALDLTPSQRKAIKLLTSGHTVVDSALAAGVNRSTLYRWLKDDLAFAAAFNAWQHDAIATARGRLLALADTAVAAVNKSMLKGDGHLALKLLTRLGISDRPLPGSTDADELKHQRALDRKRQEIERRKAADKVFWDGVLTPPDFTSGAGDEDAAAEEAKPDEEIKVRYKRSS